MTKWQLSAYKFHLHWWFRERTEWIYSESTGYNFVDLARWSNLGAVGNSQFKIGSLSQVFDMRILFLFGRKGFSYLEQFSFQWSEDRGEIGTYTYVALISFRLLCHAVYVFWKAEFVHVYCSNNMKSKCTKPRWNTKNVKHTFSKALCIWIFLALHNSKCGLSWSANRFVSIYLPMSWWCRVWDNSKNYDITHDGSQTSTYVGRFSLTENLLAWGLLCLYL